MFVVVALLCLSVSTAPAAKRKAKGKLTNKGVTLGKWLSTEPIATGQFSKPGFPEKKVDLAARTSGGRAIWAVQPKWTDARIHRFLIPADTALYMYRTITAEKAITLTGGFGSDDGCAAWLNGKQILSSEGMRGVDVDSDKVKLNLRKGKNELLFKIYNARGKSGFFFRIIEITPVKGEAKLLDKKAKRAAKRKRDSTPQPGTVTKVGVTSESLKLAINDLGKKFPQYKASNYLKRLEALGDKAVEDNPAFMSLAREALLANPRLDFDKLIVLKRNFGEKASKVISTSLGMPSLNSRTHDSISNPAGGWDNEIVVMSNLRAKPKITTLYKPKTSKMVCDIDLHFDAEKLMFSAIGSNNRWHIFEMPVQSGSDPVQLTPGNLPDIDFFDSCYLPNGKFVTTSTAPYQGLPCENGGRSMASIYLIDPKTKKIRQLTFEQDSDWCPTVLNNGRLMYLRWEYTDLPHYFSRILFHSNPDGTAPMEYYGSNSYFPNAYLFARPIPTHATKVVGVVGGHHGISRSGRLLILDPAKGRFEADGVVQEIPGRGKEVLPIIVDRLVDGIWPQFLHPYPLDDEYYLVTAKLNHTGLWGIYLVDTFDNFVLVSEIEGSALLEPMPLRKVKTPPVLPDKVDMSQKNATVLLTDIYTGPGLKGVPKGTVKKLRLFSYHYAHHRSGGHQSVGVESSWDVKRILGTVPVETDGSALFTIPANIPISIQPLDDQGQALQIMRSWMVGMPGEFVSCIGCHESQNETTAVRATLAAKRQPSKIAPWYGPARPFAFQHDVQPVLNKFCVGCHNEKPHKGKIIHNFTAAPERVEYKFDKAYMALQQYVRRPGPESDSHLTTPMEYHASTSTLIRMLRKGHHNVKLDREGWEKLYAWIDLNAPHRGKWAPRVWCDQDQTKRRVELSRMYAGVDVDVEAEYDKTHAELAGRKPVKPIMPAPEASVSIKTPKIAGWPFSTEEAAKKQSKLGKTEMTLKLGRTLRYRNGKCVMVEPVDVELKLVKIPAGQFVMGSPNGDADARAMSVVKIEKPYWMSSVEVTNAMYKLFDPKHDSRYIDNPGKDQRFMGVEANTLAQPVVRISWIEATAFCKWLSAKTGRKFTLPTEAQWEWACRAGTDSDMSYGSTDENFSKLANFADSGAHRLPFPRVSGVRDGGAISIPPGRYTPNAWGLYDMHGNVGEWTMSDYKAYPYIASDGRNAGKNDTRKVVRGGSWRDLPKYGSSAHRRTYQPFQKVFDIGLRVVCEAK
jgi:formylglycine-generating enzyme required for sulfatase activity